MDYPIWKIRKNPLNEVLCVGGLHVRVGLTQPTPHTSPDASQPLAGTSVRAASTCLSRVRDHDQIGHAAGLGAWRAVSVRPKYLLPNEYAALRGAYPEYSRPNGQRHAVLILD